MDGDREGCLAAGMDDYLTKPIRPDVVAEVLARWIATQEPGGALGPGGPALGPGGSAAGPGGSAAGGLPAAPPAGGVGAEPPAVDPERLELLRGLDDGSGLLLADLAAQFLQQTSSIRSEIAAAVDAGDCATVRRLAHLVKGGGANIGVTGLAEICARLEASSQDGRLEDARGLLQQFDLEFARVRVALGALVVEPAR
jgi:HPt (histidine-containing phosphotransfer) domain-containing protein